MEANKKGRQTSRADSLTNCFTFFFFIFSFIFRCRFVLHQKETNLAASKCLLCVYLKNCHRNWMAVAAEGAGRKTFWITFCCSQMRELTTSQRISCVCASISLVCSFACVLSSSSASLSSLFVVQGLNIFVFALFPLQQVVWLPDSFRSKLGNSLPFFFLSFLFLLTFFFSFPI